MGLVPDGYDLLEHLGDPVQFNGPALEPVPVPEQMRILYPVDIDISQEKENGWYEKKVRALE